MARGNTLEANPSIRGSMTSGISVTANRYVFGRLRNLPPACRALRLASSVRGKLLRDAPHLALGGADRTGFLSAQRASEPAARLVALAHFSFRFQSC